MYSSRVHAVLQPHRGHGAVVRASVCKQHWIFDEHTQTPEDEGREQVEVDVVACAEQLPERNIEKTEKRRKYLTGSVFYPSVWQKTFHHKISSFSFSTEEFPDVDVIRPEAAENQTSDEQSSQRDSVSDAVDQPQSIKVIFLEQNMKYSSVRGIRKPRPR